MQEESIKERIEKLKGNIAGTSKKPLTRWQKIKKSCRKIIPVAIATAVVGGLAATYFAGDFLTKRQNYPERNVLFRSSNVIYMAGNASERASKADKESISKYYAGGGIESKVGTYLFETTRELRGDIEYYNMDNSQKIRIASSTQKPEKFQAGIRLGGSLNFREEFAEIVTGSKSKAPQKYMVYKFAPERGLEEKDVDVVEHEDGSREMINRLVELRSWPLGWMFGKEIYRAGTLLEDFVKTPENEELAEEFLKKIRILDSPETIDKSKREKLAKEIMEIGEKMERKTVYASFEDGLFKMLPQESTVYLGYKPGVLERFKHWLGFGLNDCTRLRVENHWNLWPGHFPLLSELHFGSGENTLYPFDKYNNGGYTLEDKFGKIAQIDIRDFILYYGQDVIYQYYLDLNGDGQIDKKSELIGEVLCRTTHDEKKELEKLVKGERPNTDTTLTMNFSFMSPTTDLKRGMDYLRFCAYVESTMPDQIHRGFGRHSFLGFINDERSDIILYSDLSVGNMSRALTQESTLVARYDIVRLLIAAKRPYAQQLAEDLGIGEDFAGRYQSSELLRERLQIGNLPKIAAVLALGAGAYYLYRRKKDRLKYKEMSKSGVK